MLDQLAVVETFRALMLADGALAALVGTNIYPLVVDSETWSEDAKAPFIVTMISEEAQEPTYGAPASGYKVRLDVAAYALSYATMHAVAARVRIVMNLWDTITDGTVKGAPVFFAGDNETFDVSAGMYVKTMAFDFFAES